MNQIDLREFQVPLKVMMDICHGQSKASGWWHDPITGYSLIPDHTDIIGGKPALEDGEAIIIEAWFPYVIGTKIALIHSEISEALEAYRVDAQDDKLSQFKGISVELMDAFIRIGDLLGCLGLTGEAAQAFVHKINFNANRPDHKLGSRVAVGGKKF